MLQSTRAKRSSGASADAADAIGAHYPDSEPGFGCDLQRRQIAVFGGQKELAVDLADPLDGEISVDRGDDNPPVGRLLSAIDDQCIAGANAGADHGLPFDTDEKGGGRVFDDQLVEIETAIEVVLGGRGETGGGARLEKRQGQGPGGMGGGDGYRGGGKTSGGQGAEGEGGGPFCI